MNDAYANRRGNLRLLIEQWGGPLPLAKKLGYANASFLVQMAGPNPTREVTEKTGRKIETVLDLPVGWMDQQPGNHSHPVTVDVAMVAAIVRIVAQTAEDNNISLSPDKLGDVVALVYEDAEAHGNQVRQDFVNRLLKVSK